MPELRDFLPAEPPYLPLPRGLVEGKEMIVRRVLRKVSSPKLQELYDGLRAGTIVVPDEVRAMLIPFVEEVLWERGKLSYKEY